MRIHILVEGPSEKALLDVWFPRFLPGHRHHVIVLEGRGKLPLDIDVPPDPKQRTLLHQLPAKLKAFGRTLDPATDRVLVLLDLDTSDRDELEQRLNTLLTAVAARGSAPNALFRLAIEEVEAFYLGDPPAIRAAFPCNERKLRAYRQDSICGTWEVFQAVIAAPVEDKVGWAERIAPHLGTAFDGPDANRSPSFRQFCLALRQLAGEDAAA